MYAYLCAFLQHLSLYGQLNGAIYYAILIVLYLPHSGKTLKEVT